MNFPYGLFLFGVAFFGFMAILGVVQAHRKKEKTYYLSAMVGFLVILAFVLAFFDQLILAFIVVIATGIFSIVGLPRALKVQEEEMTERLQKTDFSVPLKKRYFLSDIWWLKLASKCGLGKTMCLFYLVFMAIIGGILFIFSAFIAFITIEYIAVYATTSSILFTFMFYQQFKKALKKNAEHKNLIQKGREISV